MNQYATLVRVMLKFGMRGGKKEGEKRRGNSTAAIILAVALVVVGFGAMFVTFGVLFGEMCAGSLRAAAAVFTLALCAVEGFLLIFAVIYLLSVMYFSKDNEFLLHLPVKTGTIFLAKLTTVYLYLAAYSALAVLAFGIPFGIAAGLTARFYLMLLPVMLLLPFAPIFVGTLLSFPLMYLVSFFRRSRMLATVLVILGVAAFAAFYIVLYGNIFSAESGDSGTDSPPVQEDITLPAETVDALDSATKYIFFNRCFAGLGIDSENVGVDVASLFGSYIAFAGLTYLLSATLYRRGMSRQLETGGEVVTKAGKEFKVNSPRKALVLKELRTVLRTPMLLFYSLFELVFPVVFLIIFTRGFTSQDFTAGLAEEAKIFVSAGMLCMALLFGLVFGCSMNYVALTSISREGKNFYLMKLIPVPVLQQLEVKGLMAYAFSFLSVLVVSVWMMCLGIISVLSGVCYLLFTAILAYGFTFYQVGLDIKRPRLDYDNMTQMMKNNTNALVCMGVNFLFTIVACGVIFGMTLLAGLIGNQLVLELIIWAILLVGAGACCYLMRKSYLKNALVRFEQIEG